MQQRVAGAGKAWNILANMRYKIASVIVWFGAVIATAQFLDPILDRRGLGGQVVLWAVVLQFVLTIIESEFWAGQRGQVSSAAVGVDTLINAAGLYPFVGGLSLTNVWAMIADATNASSDLSTVAVVVISLFLGYILAATPERVWR